MGFGAIPTKLVAGRSDGITLSPWVKEQSLNWEATCLDTFADSYTNNTSSKAQASEDASTRKMGPWGLEVISFIDKIGPKLQNITGDK